MSENWNWTETRPGHWERHVDHIEDYFVTVADLTRPVGGDHFSTSFGAQIKFQPDKALGEIESALKQAWAALRFDLPQLASIVEDRRMIYETLPDDLTMQEWLSCTVVINTSSNSSAELFPRLHQSPKQAMLHYLPKSSEVVIHTAHWRLDGYGATLLLSQLLQHVVELPTSTITFGSEPTRLYPSHFVLLKAPENPPESSQKITDQSIFDYVTHLPSIQIPSVTGATPKLVPATHRQEITLNQQQTADLIASAKARGVSLTVVAHAAMIRATKAMNPDITLDESAKYACICPVSIRDLLPTPYDGPAYAASVAMTGVPIGFMSTTFNKDIDRLQDLYRNELKHPGRIEGLRAFQNKMTESLKQPPVVDIPTPTHPTLNSLGLIERYLKQSYQGKDGEVKVDKFWVGTGVVDHTVWVYIWTWKEQLTISATYNTGMYDDHTIEDFLRQFLEVLTQKLIPTASTS